MTPRPTRARIVSISIAVVLGAPLHLGGCAASSYHPQQAAPRELHWRFDNGLEVHGSAGKVAGQATWDGLPQATRCVHEAKVEAETARAQALTGKVLGLSGLVATIVGMGIFLSNITLLHAGTPEQQRGQAIGAMLFLSGPVFAIAGASFEGVSFTHALDAVNLYNDEQRTRPGCARAGPK